MPHFWCGVMKFSTICWCPFGFRHIGLHEIRNSLQSARRLAVDHATPREEGERLGSLGPRRAVGLGERVFQVEDDVPQDMQRLLAELDIEYEALDIRIKSSRDRIPTSKNITGH